MPPEVLKYLEDARQACELLQDFTRGKCFGFSTVLVELGGRGSCRAAEKSAEH
jgi:hypothetical protein